MEAGGQDEALSHRQGAELPAAGLCWVKLPPSRPAPGMQTHSSSGFRLDSPWQGLASEQHLWVPLQGCFGGPGGAERDRQRCHRGGEGGKAVPVLWPQEMAKKIRVRKKKEPKKPSRAPLLVPVLGSPAPSPAGAPGVGFGTRGKCHLGAPGDTALGLQCSQKRGAGGCPVPARCSGDFWWSSHGSFFMGLMLRAEPAACAGSPSARERVWAQRGGGEGVPGVSPRGVSIFLGERGWGELGTDPFLKVTAVGSSKQRRCDYFGELRELHWPDSHK